MEIQEIIKNKTFVSYNGYIIINIDKLINEKLEKLTKEQTTKENRSAAAKEILNNVCDEIMYQIEFNAEDIIVEALLL